jgi:hypothetical protein
MANLCDGALSESARPVASKRQRLDTGREQERIMTSHVRCERGRDAMTSLGKCWEQPTTEVLPATSQDAELGMQHEEIHGSSAL